MIAACLLTASCSTPVVKESTPEERVRDARKDIEKNHFEKASQNLEELRLATAGTRLGGEVLFLLGEADFKRGKYPEAESQYAAYLNAYPDGPFSEQAIFMEAMAKVKQVQKRKVGFLTFRTYIPYDRDISLLTEARSLFEAYVEKYPEGKWVEDASQKAEELRLKEGQHDLEIASFYLRKHSPASALARARKVLEGNYPESVLAQARDLMRKAQDQLDRAGKGKDL